MDLGFVYYIRRNLSPDFKKIKERIMSHFPHSVETMSILTLLKDNN
jgi:hypothetical protein